MRQHFFYIVYILSIIIGSGWYIIDQKSIISDQKNQIKELMASQAPPIVPEKRKIKIEYKDVIKKVTVTDDKCIKAYEDLKAKTFQCAYNLKYCQESSSIYNQMKKGSTGSK